MPRALSSWKLHQRALERFGLTVRLLSSFQFCYFSHDNFDLVSSQIMVIWVRNPIFSCVLRPEFRCFSHSNDVTVFATFGAETKKLKRKRFPLPISTVVSCSICNEVSATIELIFFHRVKQKQLATLKASADSLASGLLCLLLQSLEDFNM